MSGGEDKPDLLALVKDLNLGVSRPINETANNAPVQVEEKVEHFSQYSAPAVGIKHQSNPNLISANTWEWYDTAKNKFTVNLPIFSLDALKDIFRIAAWIGADEVFLQDDECVKIKLHARTYCINDRALSAEEINTVMAELTNPSIPGKLKGGDSVPFAFTVPWRNKDNKTSYMRFRGNGVRSMGTRGSNDGCKYSLRRLGDKAPTLDDLRVPMELRKLLFPKSGLVMIAGETGSGKTTANTAVLGQIVSNPKGGVLITYESPVEFDLRTIKHPAFVVGQTDLTTTLDGSFAEACADAMRSNADTVLVGEIRDAGSAAGCINLVQSGHGVYSTFHAGSPMEFLQRFVEYFPYQQHLSVRNALVGALQLILCVKLVPTLDGKRVQIRGYLPFNREVKSILLQTKDEDFIRTVKTLYETKGHTMSADMKQYKDQIDPAEYASYMAIFDGGGDE